MEEIPLEGHGRTQIQQHMGGISVITAFVFFEDALDKRNKDITIR